MEHHDVKKVKVSGEIMVHVRVCVQALSDFYLETYSYQHYISQI